VQTTSVSPTGKPSPEAGEQEVVTFVQVPPTTGSAKVTTWLCAPGGAGTAISPGQVRSSWQPQTAVCSATDQELSVPVSPPASSSSVIVQVPFGFSPTNAPSASSGASGVATTPVA